MHPRLASAFVLTSASVALLAAPASSPADAGSPASEGTTPHCASKAEFATLRAGMTPHQVAVRLDVPGRRTGNVLYVDGVRKEWRTYTRCHSAAKYRAHIYFRNNRLASKQWSVPTA